MLFSVPLTILTAGKLNNINSNQETYHFSEYNIMNKFIFYP